MRPRQVLGPSGDHRQGKIALANCWAPVTFGCPAEAWMQVMESVRFLYWLHRVFLVSASRSSAEPSELTPNNQELAPLSAAFCGPKCALAKQKRGGPPNAWLASFTARASCSLDLAPKKREFWITRSRVPGLRRPLTISEGIWTTGLSTAMRNATRRAPAEAGPRGAK